MPVRNRPRRFAPKPKLTLKVGIAVLARFDLGRSPFQPHSMIVLARAFLAPGIQVPAPIPKGSLLIYAGTMQVNEVKHSARSGRNYEFKVLKHTFITPVGHCIIDLNLVDIR